MGTVPICGRSCGNAWSPAPCPRLASFLCRQRRPLSSDCMARTCSLVLWQSVPRMGFGVGTFSPSPPRTSPTCEGGRLLLSSVGP
eukprot:6900054-Pyramimonas_sp.AAC.1